MLVESKFSFATGAWMYVYFSLETWKCKIETQAMIWNIDLGVISIKEMLEGGGVDMNAKREYKEKMAKDRTLRGRWSTFRWVMMSQSGNNEVREEPEDLESLKTGQQFQERGDSNMYGNRDVREMRIEKLNVGV